MCASNTVKSCQHASKVTSSTTVNVSEITMDVSQAGIHCRTEYTHVRRRHLANGCGKYMVAKWTWLSFVQCQWETVDTRSYSYSISSFVSRLSHPCRSWLPTSCWWSWWEHCTHTTWSRTASRRQVRPFLAWPSFLCASTSCYTTPTLIWSWNCLDLIVTCTLKMLHRVWSTHSVYNSMQSCIVDPMFHVYHSTCSSYIEWQSLIFLCKRLYMWLGL